MAAVAAQHALLPLALIQEAGCRGGFAPAAASGPGSRGLREQQLYAAVSLAPATPGAQAAA